MYFFIEECQLINVEEMKELKNRFSAATKAIIEAKNINGY